ncbi:MAG: hypothetical protein AAFP02_20245, partial [Bacteroidota bacterium]
NYLFTDKEYDDNRLRSLLHLALGSLKEFVGFFSVQLDAYLWEERFAQRLQKKSLNSLAAQSIANLQQRLHQESCENADYFHHHFQLERLLFEQTGTQARIATNNLETLFANSAWYFMYQTLRYACNARSHANISSASYEIPLLNAVLQWIEERESEQPATILIYYYTYCSLQEYKRDIFDKLKAVFWQQHQKLPPSEQQDVLLMIINVCIKRLNTGDSSFAGEAFDLYQKGLQADLLLKQGYLSRFDYKNIVSIGLIMREFSWVADFIERYAPFLEEEYQQSYRDFNTAKLEFTRGNYRQAKRLFTMVEYDDVFFNLSAKMMLLKIYYEEQELDSLEAILDSFRRYLQRQSGLGYHKEVYGNILRLVSKMVRLAPNDEKAKKALQHQIEETQPLAERK